MPEAVASPDWARGADLMAGPNSGAGWGRRFVGWFSRNVPEHDDGGVLGEAPRMSKDTLQVIAQRLDTIERRLFQIEHHIQGGRSTYMGHGLVLVKTVIHGMQIAYLVEADDRLISPWFITSGQYETELTEHFVATLRPDDRCLDIGANFGFFTCLMARFCPQGKVIGVEPDPKIFAILRDNVHINGFGGHASARHAAVLDTVRPVTLHRRVGRSGNTSIARPSADFIAFLGEKPSEEFTVEGTTVDAIAAAFEGRVDVMKVDVEGAEPLVLEGTAAAIEANPGLQIVQEWSPGQMQGAGYDVGEFLDRVAALGLKPHALGRGGAAMSRDTLLGTFYAAGILFARKPR